MAYFREPIWQKKYRCFSIDHSYKEIANGGKIIMPESALVQLSNSNVEYPLTFRLLNDVSKETTHCSVLEFTARLSTVVLPKWMMKKLQLEEGALVTVTYIVPLPVATFAKFLPLSTVFLDISDPKGVLENTLKYFSCLTVGDKICVEFDGKQCELKVLETTPGPAVNINYCELRVDFEPPVGYVEPRARDPQDEEEQMDFEPPVGYVGPRAQDSQEQGAFAVENMIESFRAFGCQGYRCDGSTENVGAVAQDPAQRQRGIPNFDYKRDTITFRRAPRTPQAASKMGSAAQRKP